MVENIAASSNVSLDYLDEGDDSYDEEPHGITIPMSFWCSLASEELNPQDSGDSPANLLCSLCSNDGSSAARRPLPLGRSA